MRAADGLHHRAGGAWESEGVDGRIQEAAIDARLNDLGAKSEVDDALAALKAKMSAKALEGEKK